MAVEKIYKVLRPVPFPWFLYMQNGREGSMTKETLSPIKKLGRIQGRVFKTMINHRLN